MYELHDFDTASFVTFTYDDMHLARNGSLEKDMFQDYFDTLQHKVKREKGINLRFFASGEYGTHTHRSHYHAILYGLNPDPFDKNNYDRQIIAESWKKCDKHMFDWNRYDYNKNAINFVNRETCQYVAGYIQKKLKSFAAKKYEELGIEPPFKIQSKQLGLNYALQNADILRENKFVMYNGYKVAIPRYFREKLGITVEYNEEQEGFENNVLRVKNYMYDDEVQKHWTTLNMQFHAWLDSKGLPSSKIDDFEYRDIKERLFNHWYEMKQMEYMLFCEHEFRQKCKLSRSQI